MTIAQAMGGKPGSRTKKADIIDMIFELAGISPAEEAAATESPSESESESAAAEDAGEATGGTEAASEGEGGEEAAAGRRERDERPRQNGQQEQRGPKKDQQQKGEKAQQGQQQQGQQPKGQQQDQGGQQQKGQQQDQGGQQGDDDVEPGNRRRRRRGRDRDRNQPDDVAQAEPVEVEGLLDLRDEGYGFLRVNGIHPSKDDVYVSVKQTRQFSLRKGDWVKGASRPASRNEKNPALLRIDAVNGVDPDAATSRPRFEDLTPLYPDERLRLEAPGDPYNMTARIVDLVAPIGKGQRGLIVSPPKAGKTTIMKQIARSIEANDPDVHLMVLLVDERPEEVTDMRRSVTSAEVVASTFDRPAEEHVHVAELAIERAKRLVEAGEDVVIILDGITRLARAYNQAAPQTGRVMSGGIDAGAIYPPKKIFGAARNLEEGGSLTILATALVETGSRMDEVIFEEFKGTGNMELKLDRRLAERRIFPAIDVDASSTRHEELLFDNKQLQQVWKLRRVLSGMAAEGQAGASIELLTDRMRTFKSNDAFLAEVAKGATGT
ncbi:transcription termination factor Rho [Actinomarinicola tropica]|uniref:Transcription termination factor Rho n=2 Tax=Actinomarinicola tropica TaxID=2789776 RepID=A0A5Q2RUY1_9ACTN|nr:transcription termination factor Rho [Actinomarinicola tropica]